MLNYCPCVRVSGTIVMNKCIFRKCLEIEHFEYLFPQAKCNVETIFITDQYGDCENVHMFCQTHSSL